MNCQNCHELLEAGAAFCGNCGYPVQAATPQPQVAQAQQISQLPPTPVPNSAVPTTSPPSYALATPSQHAGETQALLALIFGIIGIAVALFVPAVALVFGIAGLCMGTVSRHQARRRLAIVGLIFASLAIVAGLGAWVYNHNHITSNTPANAKTGQSSTISKVSAKLATPCYSFNLIDQFNVSNTGGSCDTTAYNGQTFETSTNVYKITSTNAGTSDPGEFTALAKQAIDKDVQQNLPGFVVTNEGPSSFAGSLAYSVFAANKTQGTAVVETGVLHQTTHGEDVFDIIHAVNGSSTNLQTLEAQWQWK